MRNVVVAGVGMTPFGKFLEKSVRQQAEEAVRLAIEDAGADIADVEAVFFANAASGLITGQEMIRGQAALRRTGLMGHAGIVNVENACASGATAVHLAWLSVASGQNDVVLAVGTEKLTHEVKAHTFKAMEAGVDLEELEALKARVAQEGDGQPKSIFMDIYAEKTRKYMQASGATAADFAAIAVKSHHAATMNPLAQYRDEVTVDDVLESRLISDPITLLMCAPIGDGGAAVVICTEEYARRIGADAVRVRASTLVSGSGDSDEPIAAVRASRKAYEEAGIGPEEVDVVEVHDATAPAEMILYEKLGLCGENEGPAFLRSGAPAVGGRVPVNPSGGLLSKGHPVGATGCAQIYELTQHLRGRAGARQREGAKVALAENGGGTVGPDMAACAVTVLST